MIEKVARSSFCPSLSNGQYERSEFRPTYPALPRRALLHVAGALYRFGPAVEGMRFGRGIPDKTVRIAIMATHGWAGGERGGRTLALRIVTFENMRLASHAEPEYDPRNYG
jgi:hypothetical protein